MKINIYPNFYELKIMRNFIYIFLVVFVANPVVAKEGINNPTNESKNSSQLLNNYQQSINDSSNVKAYYEPNDSNTYGYWINLGLGISNYGPLINTGISFKFNQNLLSFNFSQANEFRFSSGGYEFDEPPLFFRDLSLSYGRCFIKENLLFIASVGIGTITGVYRGKQIDEKVYEEINFSSISFPIEVAMKIDITDNFAFGMSTAVIFNQYKTVFNGTIDIYVGVFK